MSKASTANVSNNNNNRMPTKPAASNKGQSDIVTHPIASLTPYQNK